MLYDFEKEQSKNILKGFSDIDDIIKGRKAYPIGTTHNGYKKIGVNKWRKIIDQSGKTYTDEHVDTSTFKDITHGKKNKWVVLSNKQKNSIATNLFELVRDAYAPIGGHFEIQSVKDIIDNNFYFKAIDVDDDPLADALMIFKKTDFGKKNIAVGQDGSKEGKKALLEKYDKQYHQKGYYTEVSGKLSEILLNKFHVPFVNDKALVEQVIGKEVDWIGNGWYKRNVSGVGTHEKIMVGLPKLKEKEDGKDSD